MARGRFWEGIEVELSLRAATEEEGRKKWTDEVLLLQDRPLLRGFKKQEGEDCRDDDGFGDEGGGGLKSDGGQSSKLRGAEETEREGVGGGEGGRRDGLEMFRDREGEEEDLMSWRRRASDQRSQRCFSLPFSD